MTAAVSVAAVDLGGSKMALARVDAAMRLEARWQTPTETSSQDACYAALCDRIAALIDETGPVAAIGVATASMVDHALGRVVQSTHLPLHDFALRDALEERFHVPVAVDNDATAATIAEHRHGAGRGVDHLVLLTIGTGIGGGMILGGEPYRGATGAAGEFGHLVVDLDGRSCSGTCPGVGCLETLVSGTVLDATARRLADERPSSAFGRAAAVGEPVDGALVTLLAKQGDTVALAAFERLGEALGAGVTGLVNALNPELVIIGGSVAAAGDLLLEPARRIVRERGLRPQRDQVRLVTAGLGADAGLIGAAALAFDRLRAAG